MITVFGATGNTGSVVARELLGRGAKVRVVGRSREKLASLGALGAEVFEGDTLDAKSVSEALRDAESTYLLLPPDPTTNDAIARNRRIADNYAAGIAAQGVKHAVFLSSVGAELSSGNGPIATAHIAEKTLSAVPGLQTTFVRAAYFIDNLLAYVQPIKQDGVLPVFGGGEAHAFPMVATDDIGRVAAKALLEKETGIIELHGPSDASFDDAAQAASRILGREVKAVAVPIDRLVPTLTGFGVSAHFAGLVREMTEGFGKGAIRFQGVGKTVRGTTTVEAILRRALT